MEGQAVVLTRLGSVLYHIATLLALVILALVLLVPAVVIAIPIGIYFLVFKYIFRVQQTQTTFENLTENEEINFHQHDLHDDVSIDDLPQHTPSSHPQPSHDEKWVVNWKHVRHRSSTFTKQLIGRILDSKPLTTSESFESSSSASVNGDEIIAVPTPFVKKMNDDVLSFGYFVSNHNDDDEITSQYTTSRSEATAPPPPPLSIQVPGRHGHGRNFSQDNSPSWLNRTAKELDTIISVSSPTLSSSFAYKNFITKETRHTGKETNIGEVMSV